jgi:hypothetical protein
VLCKHTIYDTLPASATGNPDWEPGEGFPFLPAGSLAEEDRRILARVQPQVWVNDYAIDSAPSFEIDITAQVVAMDETEARAIKDYSDDSDRVNHPDYEAPEGDTTFVVVCEYAIADHFDAYTVPCKDCDFGKAGYAENPNRDNDFHPVGVCQTCQGSGLVRVTAGDWYEAHGRCRTVYDPALCPACYPANTANDQEEDTMEHIYASHLVRSIQRHDAIAADPTIAAYPEEPDMLNEDIAFLNARIIQARQWVPRCSNTRYEQQIERNGYVIVITGSDQMELSGGNPRSLGYGVVIETYHPDQTGNHADITPLSSTFVRPPVRGQWEPNTRPVSGGTGAVRDIPLWNDDQAEPGAWDAWLAPRISRALAQARSARNADHTTL